jgi:hypothetical protein
VSFVQETKPRPANSPTGTRGSQPRVAGRFTMAGWPRHRALLRSTDPELRASQNGRERSTHPAGGAAQLSCTHSNRARRGPSTGRRGSVFALACAERRRLPCRAPQPPSRNVCVRSTRRARRPA